MLSQKFAAEIHESPQRLLADYPDAGGDLRKLSGAVNFLCTVFV
jgi:hypothetical protein